MASAGAAGAAGAQDAVVRPRRAARAEWRYGDTVANALDEQRARIDAAALDIATRIFTGPHRISNAMLAHGIPRTCRRCTSAP